MRAFHRLLCGARVMLAAAALPLAACVQLPPTPQDLQAKRFEPAADKAVIYLVRDAPDFSDVAATIRLDEIWITTYPGTYYRWEVPPGAHRIAGVAADTGQTAVNAQPGEIYFIQQRVTMFMGGFAQSFFHHVAEPNGRAAVLRSVLLRAP